MKCINRLRAARQQPDPDELLLVIITAGVQAAPYTRTWGRAEFALYAKQQLAAIRDCSEE